MERQKNSDITVEAKFTGVPLEHLPDFVFQFYTELHQSETYTCSKTGGNYVNCVASEPEVKPPGWGTVVRCIIENHNFKPGRLCVLAHIKWVDPDFEDGINNEIVRKKLELVIKP